MALPIIRVHVPGKFVEVSVDQNGQFQSHSEEVPLTPDEPVLNVAAQLGIYDVKVFWYEGQAEPEITAIPGIKPGSGGSDL